MEAYLIPENILSSHSVLSPSGQYKLIINNYKTKEGCWSYSKGIVTRIGTEEIVDEIPRNYSFNYSFIIKDGCEWLIAGRKYLSQYFLNMDTGEHYDNDVDAHRFSFCWIRSKANPDGSILAVEGCVWACPCELEFYDISDLSKGWPIIPVVGLEKDMSLYIGEEYKLEWLSNTVCKFTYMYFHSDRFGCDIEELAYEDHCVLTGLSEEDYDKEVREMPKYSVTLEKVGLEMKVIESVKWS